MSYIINLKEVKKMKRIMAIAVLSLGIAVGSNAMAADWNFYGSARVSTFWADEDDGTSSSETNFSEGLQSNSRIGAKVQVSDELIGRFEYGASGGNANIRHLYGEWDFGAGKLLVGQTDSLMKITLSNQVYDTDANMKKYGSVDAGRRAMVRLSFGGFQIAAIEVNRGTGYDQAVIPKIELKYKFNTNAFAFEVAGGYQTYETAADCDVDSYVLALGGKFNFGPGYARAGGWFGQNVGPYGLANSGATNDDPTVNGTDINDNDGFGIVGSVGFKINDMFALEGGLGYVSADLDGATDEDTAMAYYVQATIKLASGVLIVPEIGFLDEMDDLDGSDEGDTLYYGMKWQINF